MFKNHDQDWGGGRKLNLIDVFRHSLSLSLSLSILVCVVLFICVWFYFFYFFIFCFALFLARVCFSIKSKMSRMTTKSKKKFIRIRNNYNLSRISSSY